MISKRPNRLKAFLARFRRGFRRHGAKPLALICVVSALLVVVGGMICPMLMQSDTDSNRALKLAFAPGNRDLFEGPLFGDRANIEIQELPSPLQEVGAPRSMVIRVSLLLLRKKDDSMTYDLGWAIVVNKPITEILPADVDSKGNEITTADWQPKLGSPKQLLVTPHRTPVGSAWEELHYIAWIMVDAPVESQGTDTDGNPVQSWGVDWTPTSEPVYWTYVANNSRIPSTWSPEPGPVTIRVCPDCGVLQSYNDATETSRDQYSWQTTSAESKHVEFATSWRPFGMIHAWAALLISLAITSGVGAIGTWAVGTFRRSNDKKSAH